MKAVGASYRTPGDPRPLRGSVTVPGDKSISHRALILSALAEGRSSIRGCNLGRDVLSTVGALRALGVGCTVDREAARAEVQGQGWEGMAEPSSVVDAGNSGTTLRLLLGVCAALPVRTVLSGDASLRRRPMRRVVEPLRAMGAVIEGPEGADRPPLSVEGRPLRAVTWRSSVASAQVKSAVLLAALRAEGITSYREPLASRDHTERMLSSAGVRVELGGSRVRLAGGQPIRAMDRTVPGDISSAIFLVVAATLAEGSNLTITDVGLNPSRTGALDVLVRMGADVTIRRRGDVAGEPFGDVQVRAAALRPTSVSPEEVPALIDEIPALAVAAAGAAGTTVFSGAGELRFKESDRIEAMVLGLRAAGVPCRAEEGGLTLTGPSNLEPARIDPHGDHRIALAFAAAGLAGTAAFEIDGWDCTEVSFPRWHEIVSGLRTDGR